MFLHPEQAVVALFNQFPLSLQYSWLFKRINFAKIPADSSKLLFVYITRDVKVFWRLIDSYVVKDYIDEWPSIFFPHSDVFVVHLSLLSGQDHVNFNISLTMCYTVLIRSGLIGKHENSAFDPTSLCCATKK